jgi:hypothetical protein
MSRGDWVVLLMASPIALWFVYIVVLAITNTVCGKCLTGM